MGRIIGIKTKKWNQQRKYWAVRNETRHGRQAVQDGLPCLEVGIVDKLYHLEATLNPLLDLLLPNQESPSHATHHREHNREGRHMVSSKTVKLEFSRFSGDNPTEWFNRMNQIFEFQNTPEAQRVAMASYHLEG